MPRPPRPDDLYRLRVATEPRVSPDGRRVAFVVQTVSPGFDGYRHAIWQVDTDGGSPARQVTLGSKHDHHPRYSPDGRTLAFISDRRTRVEEDPVVEGHRRGRSGHPDRGHDDTAEDVNQVYLLPLDGGEARRLSDLPRGVEAFEWSPDGTRLVVVSTSHGATRSEDDKRRAIDRRRDPGAPPDSDYRYLDRLDYMLNGAGFTYDKVRHLWLVDVATGTATQLTDGRVPDGEPAWSPNGRRIAFTSNRRRDADLFSGHSDIHVVDVETRAVTAVTRGPRSMFTAPRWLPDGRTIAALGHRLEGGAGSRNDIWLFRADGRDATPTGGRNLSGPHDLMPGSGMNSDVTRGEGPVLVASKGGRWLHFSAPVDGAYELWRIAVADGRVERLTQGQHYISGWDAVPHEEGGGVRIAYLRSTATETPDVWILDAGGTARGSKGSKASKPRRLTSLNADILDDVELRAPTERHVTVDGRDIQGWFIPAGDGPRPLVLEIHGGPHTLYGWSLVWEFQVLAAAGIGVFYCNPRGSEGYGEAFNDANHRDWGPGPTRDVLAGVDALVADGLADPDRLGVTGGSYGGYLTSWIVGHDDRFRAAMTARSVNEMGVLFTTGDISGGDWARLEFETTPWEDPEYFREISPLTYADRIRTPLLIQHSERDIRTTIAQAEALFTVLRSLRRPVRLLRVPDENHELTRSGTPYRRVENLHVVEDWFRHFLVAGKRGLPPVPKVHGGR
ncbi:MAG: S9 family peptidase [Chloroflexota bacterium]